MRPFSIPKLTKRSALLRPLALSLALVAGGFWLTSCGGGVSSESEFGKNERIIGSYGRQGGQFSKPRAVVVTDDEQLVVIDRTGRIQVFDLETGKFIRKWNLIKYDNGTPTGASLDPQDGSIWVADTHNQRILRYNVEGELLDSFGEYGNKAGQLIFPTDVYPDPDGETVWVCEYGLRSRVMQFTREGDFIQEWGSGEYDYVDLYRPMSISVTPERDILILDTGNHRVILYDREGHVKNSWGEPGQEPGQLYYPQDLAVAPDGTVVIVEYGNSRVSHFTADGEYLGRWGGPGYGPGQLFSPWGIAVSPSGEVVVADTGNSRLHVIKSLKDDFLTDTRSVN